MRLAAFALGLLLAVQALAQTPVDLQGILPEDAAFLKRKYPTAMNDPTPAALDELLRILFALNHYEDLQVHYNAGYRIVGVPIRRIETVNVRGNSNMSSSEILKVLNIRQGDRPARRQILDSVENLTKEYNRKGFLTTAVEVSFLDQKSGRVDVSIDVREGPRARIKQLEMETSNRELQRDMAKLVASFVGQPLAQTTIDEIVERVKDYFVENRYLNAQLPPADITLNAQKTEAVVRFTLENPYRFSLSFEGNKEYSVQELMKRLNLKSAERLGFNPGAELSDRLKQLYQREGFAGVQVSFDERLIAADYIRQFRFTIKEGPKVRVRGIEVTGRISKPAEEYADFIKEHSGTITERGYYNADELEQGYKNLVVHLQNQGFLKAKVQSTRTSFNKDGSQATVHVFLDEGPLTKIREIQFKGLKSFSREELYELIGLREGSPLHLNVLEESLRRIQEYYIARGYLDAKILNDEANLVRYSEDNTEATLVFEIEEGPQVKVASILVEGNEITREDVFLREIEFRVGDTLTGDKIRDSISRLQRMGLFSRVDIRTLEQGTSISERTVVVDVTERNPGLFNIGTLVNLEVTTEFYPSLRLYSGIAYRNLGGTARALSARGEINANFNLENFLEHDLNLGYLEPFMFNDRIRGRVNLSRSLNIFRVDRTADRRLITALETNQLSLLLEKDLTRTLKLTWNAWSLATSRKYSTASSLDLSKVNIGTVGPIVEWDRRDHPFVPTTGFLYRISADYSHPSLGNTDSIEFFKTSTGLNTYTRLLGPRLVWANSIRGGYLRSLSSEARARVPEEVIFSLGGRSTVRGFNQLLESIPSREEFRIQKGIDPNSEEPMFVTGHSTFYLLKSELRFPIAGELGGVFFYDGGAVHISDVTFEDPYRDSAGLGIRYETPVGPFSLEIAWKLDRKDRVYQLGTSVKEVKEDPFRVHLSIGMF
ncbi:MAG TPA: POTRA domain-containing protein [Bdellovibrionales bacterium]|nr:POTRA domain-containing protein [Bdellovibrionales bacterium]